VRPTSRHPFRAAVYFNIRHTCSTNSPQTTGFYVQTPDGADMQSIMCIYHPDLVHSIVRPDGLTPAMHVHLTLPESTVRIIHNRRSTSTLARYRKSQRVSVHAVRGQGVDPACPTSVTYTPIYPPHRFLLPHTLYYHVGLLAHRISIHSCLIRNSR
jgi:hypothetical protein